MFPTAFRGSKFLHPKNMKPVATRLALTVWIKSGPGFFECHGMSQSNQ